MNTKKDIQAEESENQNQATLPFDSDINCYAEEKPLNTNKFSGIAPRKMETHAVMQTKNETIGRPPMEEADKCNKIVSTYTTEAVRDAFKELAKSQNKKVAELLRELVENIVAE